MSVAMEDWPRRHRFTVEEYFRMAEVARFAPNARVSLSRAIPTCLRSGAGARQ
jgi:hypothetical protein